MATVLRNNRYVGTYSSRTRGADGTVGTIAIKTHVKIYSTVRLHSTYTKSLTRKEETSNKVIIMKVCNSCEQLSSSKSCAGLGNLVSTNNLAIGARGGGQNGWWLLNHNQPPYILPNFPPTPPTATPPPQLSPSPLPLTPAP